MIRVTFSGFFESTAFPGTFMAERRELRFAGYRVTLSGSEMGEASAQPASLLSRTETRMPYTDYFPPAQGQLNTFLALEFNPLSFTFILYKKTITKVF